MQVYAQVQMLFRGNADLLEEFKQFLPDTSATAAPGPVAGRSYQGLCVCNVVIVKMNHLSGPQQGYQPQQQQLQYGKRTGGAQMPSGPQKQTGFMPKGKRGPNGTTFQGSFAKVLIDHRRITQLNTIDFSQKSRYDLARGSQKAYNHQFGAAEEFEFFEKVKKVLGNKQSYIEFLKVLNLFNQDIIDPKLLVEKVEPFLARVPELLDWFKVYVRYDETHQMPEIVSTEPPNHDLADAKRSGSSYRLLPNDYLQPPCSGRDSLCYEVLNDNWTCHPTWASEDGGFVAHKKNQFEEALYRCEEERYEFDLNIEANKSIIQRLEPIAKRIAEMSADEARTFKLPEGLGDGMSKTILRRVVKKVYDKDRGQEVLDSLIEHPAVAVPIVLKRLKQKDEEWRRNQVNLLLF
jgi:paired amphipathic helix protein Sin3a